MVASTDLVPLGGEGASDPPELEARIGQVIAGRYRVMRHMRSGGTSHVFEAEDLTLGRRYALKLLRPEMVCSHRMTERLRREARALGRLRSDHVVSVVDFGTLGDQTPFLILELLEGEDLRGLLERDGILAVPRAIKLAIDACHGLHEAHAAGLIHRDLKPENLFVVRRSNGDDSCKLLDFGLAKTTDTPTTAQGALVGTVRYIAPEQLANPSDVGPATDVYALGAILYECLAGAPAHPGEGLEEIMYNVLHRTPERLDVLHHHVPAPLAELVARCLDHRPQQRPASARELARLLRVMLEAPFAISRRSPTTREQGGQLTSVSAPASSSSPRVRWIRRGVSIVVSALAGLAAGVALQARPQHAPSGVPQPPDSLPSPAVDARVVDARVVEALPVPTRAEPVAPAEQPSALTQIEPPARRPRPSALREAAPAASARAVVARIDEVNPYRE